MSDRRRERFLRLAETRTNKAMRAIRLVGNFANRSNYTWTDREIKKIFDALEKELKLARSRFTASHRKEFSL